MEFWTSFIILSLMVSVAGGVSTWSYSGSNGPSHWKDMAHSKCGLSRQSPINIDTQAVEDSNMLSAFRLYNFNKPLNTTISNNGHTVTVRVNGGDLRVEGGGLSGGYKALQFHFHWGHNDSRGSEHTLNGQRFPMEMHVVCMQEGVSHISAALEKSDGLAVLGFFFEVSDTNNMAVDSLVNRLPAVKNADSTSNFTDVKLGAILPSILTEYYRYDGSLTTPDCNEAVVWTVFRETIKISSIQLMKFRELLTSHMVDNEYEPLVDNYRPVQNIGDRKVYFRVGVSVGSQLSLSVLIPPLMISVLLHLY
ncbi:putative carbonic anhydrase 3 [Gigantopelta aegis]|uniref:putative carbonic anhydrase 3 n=1 Tax=Gigantopelta aegis TaxID=1735272 RepID=UPI001B888515|nr:putative carbonic anhydrase 3 [Gigantopelta aegis]